MDGGSWYKEDGSKPLLEEVVKLLEIDMILVIHDDQIYVGIFSSFHTRMK